MFACAVSSEPISSSLYAERRLVAPLRDGYGRSAVLVDMNLGAMDSAAVPSTLERAQIGHLLRLCDAANAEVVAESLHARKVRCLGKSLLLCVVFADENEN